jgi:hypothetical protein
MKTKTEENATLSKTETLELISCFVWKRKRTGRVCVCVYVLWKCGLWMIQTVDGEPIASDGPGGSVLTLGAPSTPLIPTRSHTVLFFAKHEQPPPLCISISWKTENYLYQIRCPGTSTSEMLWTTHAEHVVTASMSLRRLWAIRVKHIRGHHKAGDYIRGDYNVGYHIYWRSLSSRKWCRIVWYIGYSATCCFHLQGIWVSRRTSRKGKWGTDMSCLTVYGANSRRRPSFFSEYSQL